MNELISVIINVYNGEKFIAKCLESIINQTYKNLEILIINDGSTDNTLKICEEYKDSRIRIINQENMGLSLARNVGIDNAKGEYLYFVDSDDFVELDVIEYLYGLCKKHNTKLSTCLPMQIYDYNYIARQKHEKIEIITPEEMLKKILLGKENACAIWNKLIHKNLFQKLRFENRIINDIATTYKLMLETDKIAYSNQIKYYYLRNRGSITAKSNTDRFIDLYKVAIERYENIKKIYSEFPENEMYLLRTIIRLYCITDKELETFLGKQNAIEVFKTLFSFKLLIKCKIKNKTKIKIALFWTSPKLCKTIVNKYKFIRYRYKM